jgi:colicin import membrane protein
MRSMVLAIAMHLGLLLFLWVGIRWQNNEPVAVEAEVWDMKVQSAAPPAPPAPPAPEEEPEPVVKTPPPAPPVEAPPLPKEPDIALERLKAKKKAELEKLEELKQAKLKKEADEKLAKLEQKRLADKKLKEDKDKQDKLDKEKKLAADKLAKTKLSKAAEQARAAEMLRITGAVGAGTSGTAAKATGPRSDGSYESAIKAKIKGNLVYATNDDTLTATFKITQLPSGEVIGVRKMKSSGSAAYDNAIENAINKSSPLPKKKDGTVEREFIADFTMKDLH